MSFNYLIDQIHSTEFLDTPFKHIELNNFFKPEHFAEIVGSDQIKLPPTSSDSELIEVLLGEGYDVISFPGTTQSIKDYLRWRSGKSPHQNLETCEGFGMPLRLIDFRSPFLRELNDFFKSAEFLNCLAEKFDIALEETYPDQGLHKYLDGYEISPHPDIRKKALTYMINVNPNPKAFQSDHHTHYMTFKSGYKYVQEYWKGNPNVDRCWVPWDWCETVKQQKENNSIVIFSPADDTLHGVRAKYDHLQFQRTQYYGNLWFHKNTTDEKKPNWRDYRVIPTYEKINYSPKKNVLRMVVEKVKG